MRPLSLLAPLLALSLSAAAAPFPAVYPVVFGADDRVPVPDVWPERARLGRLLHDAAYECSAFLVGDSLAMTAAHCVADDRGRLLEGAFSYQPDPWIDSGRSVAVTKIVHGAEGGASPAGDWAILHLAEPVGKTLGRLTVLSHEGPAVINNVFLAGYAPELSGGKVAHWVLGCDIAPHDGRKHPPGTFVHDCDMSPGMSGAPVLGRFSDGFYVLGINAGDSTFKSYSGNGRREEETLNFAVKPLAFKAALNKALP